MPTTKSLEDALRALGWEPVATYENDLFRAWAHRGRDLVIFVRRTSWTTANAARRILRLARTVADPYR